MGGEGGGAGGVGALPLFFGLAFALCAKAAPSITPAIGATMTARAAAALTNVSFIYLAPYVAAKLVPTLNYASLIC